MALRAIFDTNVLVAATRSRLGSSFKVLSLVGTGLFDLVLTVPLVLEYEDALLRHTAASGLSSGDVSALVDYLCTVGLHQPVFFLWRPLLPDPKDDMVLEAAVAASCDFLVTFNTRDFAPAKQFKLKVVTPPQFLVRIGATP